jgi:FkbM family methyltransferase
MKSYLANCRPLRRLVLPLLARLSCNITVRHQWTRQKILLHLFRHKGYWFYGRDRERETMQLFASLLSKGDTVVEIGGHIGYISLYFKHLVADGRVVVFEPGENNLPYIRANLANRGVELVEQAVGDHSGPATFFIDSLTGQNNSFIPGFEGLRQNIANAFVPVAVREQQVTMVRLDDFAAERSLQPNFVKVDVEGFELSVLRGMPRTLQECQPGLMVEVQADETDVFDLLTGHGYELFTPQPRRLLRASELRGNVFALHRKAHRALMGRLGL